MSDVSHDANNRRNSWLRASSDTHGLPDRRPANEVLPRERLVHDDQRRAWRQVGTRECSTLVHADTKGREEPRSNLEDSRLRVLAECAFPAGAGAIAGGPAPN